MEADTKDAQPLVSTEQAVLPSQVTVGTPEGDPTQKESDRNGESRPITERKRRKSRSRSSSSSSSDSDDYRKRRKRKRSPRRYSSDSESSDSEYERNKRRHHRDDYHRRRGSRERDDRGRHRSRSRERDRDRDRGRDRDKHRYRETDRHRHSRSDRSRHEDRDRHKDSNRYRSNDTGRNSAGKGSGWDNAPSQAQMQINAAVAHLQQVAQGPIVAKPPPSVIQKRKLLWGKKSEEPSAVTASWTASHFDDPNRKDKFLKLMGAKKATLPAVDPEAARPGQQQQMFQELEQGYMTAVHQRGGPTGLGFNG